MLASDSVLFLHFSGGSGLGASLFWGDLAFVWFRLSSLAFAFLSFEWSVLRASTLRGACACYSRLGVRVGFVSPVGEFGLVLFVCPVSLICVTSLGPETFFGGGG